MVTTKQEKCIAAVLALPTLDAALKVAGVSRATYFRWRKDEAFNEAFRAARTAMLEAATARIRRAADEAVGTLESALHAEHDRDRIRAASVLLDMAYKSAEVEDLADRLTALEAATADKEQVSHASVRGRTAR